MKKQLYIMTILCFFANFLHLKGQVLVGSETSSTNNEALLELNTNNKGLLFNTVTLTSLTSATPFSSHVEGMWVYNSGGSLPKGLYYNDGSKWNVGSDVIGGGSVSPYSVGEIKISVLSTDYDGWYLMDGRSLESLPTVAKNNATNIGLTSLPNMQNKYFKGKQSTEVFGDTYGNLGLTINRDNLPTISINGATSSNGAHFHNFEGSGIIPNGFLGRVRIHPGYSYINGGTYRDFFSGYQGNPSLLKSGIHNHEFRSSFGGNSTPVNFNFRNLRTAYFIYLGQ